MDLLPQALFPPPAQPQASVPGSSLAQSGEQAPTGAGGPAEGAADAQDKAPEEPKTREFLLFRDRFQLPEDRVFLLPKFYSNTPGFPRIRLIDNDTLKEMQVVFGKLVPQTYKKNQVNIFDIHLL